MKRLLRLGVLSLVLAAGVFCFQGLAVVLLVQDDDIWTYNPKTIQPYNVLKNQRILYERKSHENVASMSLEDLKGYDFIYLVGQDGESDNFVNYSIPVMNSKFSDYVSQGGLLLVHFADWENANLVEDIASGGVDRVYHFTDTGTIVSGKEMDPLFEGITDDSLDNWDNTAHGYLTDLPGNSEILIVNENNDPIYARYGLGAGEVWVTTMTMEWGDANQSLLENEIRLAAKLTDADVVPEPSSLGLVISGMLCGLLLRRRKTFS